MQDHSDLLIQEEIGESSWFGFSRVISPGSQMTRKELVVKLNTPGFERGRLLREIFAKNGVVKYFDSAVHVNLKNAEHIDQNGLFVGNHHFQMPDVFEKLSTLSI